MREKLRIDNEFRMLRSKYEIKSSVSVSSLVFSKTTNSIKK
jgi:hypothetical protein